MQLTAWNRIPFLKRVFLVGFTITLLPYLLAKEGNNRFLVGLAFITWGGSMGVFLFDLAVATKGATWPMSFVNLASLIGWVLGLVWMLQGASILMDGLP